IELRRGFTRWREQRGIQREILRQAKGALRAREPGLEYLREWPSAALAATEGGVVECSVAHLPNEGEHVLGAVGVLRVQPLDEQRFHLMRQAQQHVPGCDRAMLRGRLEHALEL